MTVKRIGLLTTLVLSMLLFGPTVFVMLTQPSDYISHMKWAYQWGATGRLPLQLPHFLFHAVTLLCAHCLSLHPSFNQVWVGAGLAAAIFYGITAAGVFFILSRHSRRIQDISWEVISALSVMLTGPIFIFTKTIYFGYITPNPLHNPTFLASRSVSIPLAWTVSKHLEPGKQKHAGGMILLLTLLSALAKPNYVLCLIPTVACLCGFRLLKRKPVNKWLAFEFFPAAGGVLLWQYWFTYHSGSTSIAWAPFLVARSYSNQLMLKLIMSSLFPLSVALLFFENIKKDLFLVLAWMNFGVGLVLFYFFTEMPRFQAGNFLWGADMSLFILFLASFRFLTLLSGNEIKSIRIKKIACYGAYLLHVACGAIAYTMCLLRIQAT